MGTLQPMLQHSSTIPIHLRGNQAAKSEGMGVFCQGGRKTALPELTIDTLGSRPGRPIPMGIAGIAGIRQHELPCSQQFRQVLGFLSEVAPIQPATRTSCGLRTESAVPR